MAITYQSVETSAWTDLTGGGTLTITKPSGLEVGDFMIAHMSDVVGGSDNAGGWTTPAGWTASTAISESGNLNSSMSLYVFYKIADAGDVAAANFSFVNTSGGEAAGIGSLWRFSGVGGLSAAGDTEINDTTPAFTNTVTPTYANCYLMMLVTSAYAGTGVNSVSGYAITTSNPATWTELYDVNRDETTSSDRGCHAAAYASRPETTATGDSTCVLSQTQNTGSVLVALYPTLSVSIDAVVTSATLTAPAPVITGDANFTSTVDSIVITAPTATVAITTPTWTNEAKPSTSWTNESKT